ncbi:ankyrin repeat domain-containing protein [Enterococcus sp. AZ192]|uniref:ankyrin repeat domain-containing protein n=1 Tax=unclassified Enterococcus TaxID=2608891 RepID=UPI003D29E9A4
MKMTTIFDAVRDGSLDDVKKMYKGDINEVNNELDLNLLCMAMTNMNNESEKIKIIQFLIDEGININYTTSKYQRNALHMLYFCNLRPSIDYMVEISKVLIDNGIDINGLDKYKAIPLKYSITINKLSTDENKPLYWMLLEAGSNFELKDSFGKSCLDYAQEYSWRNDFVKIVEEFESENK